MSDDRYTWKCDECFANNKISDDICKLCGTPREQKQIKVKAEKQPEINPKYCAYISKDGHQCPAPGVVSKRLKGNLWYCERHAETSTGDEAEKIYEEICNEFTLRKCQ